MLADILLSSNEMGSLCIMLAVTGVAMGTGVVMVPGVAMGTGVSPRSML